MARQDFFSSPSVLYLSPGEIRRDLPAFSCDPALLASLRAVGLLQPISVVRENGGYVLLSGRKRFQGARELSIPLLPCYLAEPSTSPALLALLEYLLRRDLDFVTEATVLSQLLRRHGLSQREAARLLGCTQSTISNKLRILSLSPALLTELSRAGLSQRHARALLPLPREYQHWVLRQVIDGRLTVAETEALVEKQLPCFT